MSPARRPSHPPRALLAALVVGAVGAPAFAGGVCGPEPFVDLGGGVAGGAGQPVLAASGPLLGGSDLQLTLDQAAPGASAFLVLGLSELGAPFKGGTLVPTPDIVLGGLPTGAGYLPIVATWPAGLPDGADVLFQYWVPDAGAPFGLAASNGVRGTTAGDPQALAVPEGWISGTDCANDPAFQVQQYDENTYILRQSQCLTFEGPFLYLLFGQDRVLLEDTGNVNSSAVRHAVDGVIDAWLLAHGRSSIPLVVAHTHAHSDHIKGDPQFVNRPDTTVVGTSLASVQAFFGITNWPEQIVSYDLGCRVLDVVPIPGHEKTHIALYDRNTGLLLTGDTLYPGFLFVPDFPTYRTSIRRLEQFALTRPVTSVLGTHVEMTSTPGVAYPYGTSVQPDEHTLRLLPAQLTELREAVDALSGAPGLDVHDDFIVEVF